MEIFGKKQQDLNQKDVMEIKSILEQHCPVLLHHASKINNAFINIIGLSKKCDKPILIWIIDIYHRFLVDFFINTKGKILLPIEFIDNYLGIKHLPSPIYDSLKIVITNFHRTIGSFPEIGSSVFKYDDNLTEYIQVTSTINAAIQSV